VSFVKGIPSQLVGSNLSRLVTLGILVPSTICTPVGARFRTRKHRILPTDVY